MSERSPCVLGLVTEAYGGVGGIAQYNRDFFEAMGRLPGGTDVHLLPRKAPDACEAPHSLRQYTARPSRIVYAASAITVALRIRPRIVVCGHLFMISVATVAARAAKAKLVVQLHGIEIWQPLGAVRRRALAGADLVLCVSRDTRARVLAATDLPPERVLVLPNTVAEDFIPGPRAPAANPRILLSVGRLDAREAYKGHDAVLACLPKLCERGHDVLYQIVGEGDDRPRLARLADALGVADRVRFLGYVERSALPALYRNADLFVLASRGEGFGIVFLEAMACGTPAVGLACGGAVDALEGLGRAVAEHGLLDAIDDGLTRTAEWRSAADDCNLARRVRERFGHPVFQAGVAHAMARVGLEQPEAAPIEAASGSEFIGYPT